MEVGVGDDGDSRQTRKDENWDWDCGLGETYVSLAWARVGVDSFDLGEQEGGKSLR